MVINGRFLTQPLTGVQRYAIEMTRAILTIRPDTRVLAPRNILHQSLADEFSPEIIGRGAGYFWEQVELPRHLHKTRSQPILLNFANMAPAAYSRNVIVIHDLCPLRHPEWYSRRFRLVYRYLLPVLAQRALCVITDSQFSAGEILDLLRVDPDRLKVVPCAVSDHFLSPAEPQRTPLDAEYILSVGSLDPRKNLQALAEAFLRLDDQKIRFVVVGQPNRVFAGSHRLHQCLEQAGILIRTDADDRELKTWYSHALLFVYPSLYEGFGLPPLEAMACGCPCLVSEAGALPEVCGDAAAYCDAVSIESIALHMRDLLRDEPRRMMHRERGLTRAQIYSWPRSAQRLLEAVDHLVTT